MDKSYKKNKAYKEDESDIDDEFIELIEKENMEKEIEKAEKKFAKDNEKLAEENEQPQDESVLKERIKEIKAEFKRLEKERGTKEATLKRARPAEKIEEAVQKLTDRIKTQKLQMQDRDAGKEVALGTRCGPFLLRRLCSDMIDLCPLQ
jgi:DNA topoisomerase-1